MLEREIEQYLVKRCKQLHLLCYKFSSPSNRGVPDRLILGPNGFHCFVECKSDTGRLSALQEYTIEMYQALDQQVWVINSKKGVDDLAEFITATLSRES
jgi:hypothetical protein